MFFPSQDAKRGLLYRYQGAKFGFYYPPQGARLGLSTVLPQEARLGVLYLPQGIFFPPQGVRPILFPPQGALVFLSS